MTHYLRTYEDVIRRESLTFHPGEKWLVDDPRDYVRIYNPRSYYDDTLVEYRRDIERLNFWSKVLGVAFVILLGVICVQLP